MPGGNDGSHEQARVGIWCWRGCSRRGSGTGVAVGRRRLLATARSLFGTLGPALAFPDYPITPRQRRPRRRGDRLACRWKNSVGRTGRYQIKRGDDAVGHLQPLPQAALALARALGHEPARDRNPHLIFPRCCGSTGPTAVPGSAWTRARCRRSGCRRASGPRAWPSRQYRRSRSARSAPLPERGAGGAGVGLGWRRPHRRRAREPGAAEPGRPRPMPGASTGMPARRAASPCSWCGPATPVPRLPQRDPLRDPATGEVLATRRSMSARPSSSVPRNCRPGPMPMARRHVFNRAGDDRHHPDQGGDPRRRPPAAR